MIVKIGDGYSVAHNFESQVIKLSKSYEWSIWLSSIRNCKLGTIYQFMKAIERFWIWSLYSKKTTDYKSFPFYLARYREDLLVGYNIKEKHFDNYLNDWESIDAIIFEKSDFLKIKVSFASDSHDGFQPITYEKGEK